MLSTKSLRTCWRIVGIAKMLLLFLLGGGPSSAHNTSFHSVQRHLRSALCSQGTTLTGKGQHRDGVCMISTTCAILQGRFALVQDGTEDAGEIKSLYWRVKKQLLE